MSLCPACSGTQGKLRFTVRGYDHHACPGCNSLFVFPQPSAEALARHYEFQNEYLNRIVARGFGPELVERARLLERLQPSGRQLLDVGCGPGFFLKVVRDRGWAGVGVEQSTGFAAYAVQTFGLEVLRRPLEEAGLPSGSFDVVTVTGVLEHVPQPRRFVELSAAHLKPGGVLYLLTNSSNGWLARLLRKRDPFVNPPEHLCLFSVRALRLMLARAGLEVKHLRTFDTLPADSIWRGLQRLMGRTPPPRRGAGPDIVAKAVAAALIAPLWALGAVGLGSLVEIAARKPAPGPAAGHAS